MKHKHRVNAEGEEEEDGEQPEDEDAQDEEIEPEEVENKTLKQAVQSGPYVMCRKAGLGEFIDPSKLNMHS
jgi:hypothetical protein